MTETKKAKLPALLFTVRAAFLGSLVTAVGAQIAGNQPGQDPAVWAWVMTGALGAWLIMAILVWLLYPTKPQPPNGKDTHHDD